MNAPPNRSLSSFALNEVLMLACAIAAANYGPAYLNYLSFVFSVMGGSSFGHFIAHRHDETPDT